jgi:hypothetical protein
MLARPDTREGDAFRSKLCIMDRAVQKYTELSSSLTESRAFCAPKLSSYGPNGPKTWFIGRRMESAAQNRLLN